MCTWFSASWQRFRYDRKCLLSCIYNPQITISRTSLFSVNFNRNSVKNHPKPWTCPLMATEALRLMKDGKNGGKGYRGGGKREIIYLSLQCHHQNDFCIKMGSDDSHFNVSVGSDGQSHKTVSTNHSLFEEKGEPKRYRTEVVPLTSLTTRPNWLIEC